jgi:hypothetical protein
VPGGHHRLADSRHDRASPAASRLLTLAGAVGPLAPRRAASHADPPVDLGDGAVAAAVVTDCCGTNGGVRLRLTTLRE